MTRLLALLALLAITAAAQAQTRTPASPVAPSRGGAELVPTSALDGNWRGTSDGGSCNAPLDYVLSIETGIVDGSAYDTGARPRAQHLKGRRPRRRPACGRSTAWPGRAVRSR